MTTTYHVEAITPDILKELRHQDDAGEVRAPFTADRGGEPLRCCLRKGEPGERLLLVSYAPLLRWARETGAEPGPYLELGPVFIHAEDCDGPTTTGYPLAMHGAQRVYRTYDADGHIAGGRYVELSPEEAADAAADRILAELFSDPDVALIHVRAVIFGCFQFAVHPAR